MYTVLMNFFFVSISFSCAYKQGEVATGTGAQGNRDPDPAGPRLHAQTRLLPPWSQAGERALQRDRNGQARWFRVGQGDPVEAAFYRLRLHQMVPLKDQLKLI